MLNTSESFAGKETVHPETVKAKRPVPTPGSRSPLALEGRVREAKAIKNPQERLKAIGKVVADEFEPCRRARNAGERAIRQRQICKDLVNAGLHEASINLFVDIGYGRLDERLSVLASKDEDKKKFGIARSFCIEAQRQLLTGVTVLLAGGEAATLTYENLTARQLRQLLTDAGTILSFDEQVTLLEHKEALRIRRQLSRTTPPDQFVDPEFYFGKYNGLRISEVGDQHPDYLAWMLNTKERGELGVGDKFFIDQCRLYWKRLNAYGGFIDLKVPFGRNKGRALSELVTADRDWLIWASQNNFSSEWFAHQCALALRIPTA